MARPAGMQRLVKDRHSATIAAIRAKERDIQANFVAELDRFGGDQVFRFSVPNERRFAAEDEGERRRNIGHLRALMRAGLVPGVPDLIVLWRGGGCGIEFKSADGSLRDIQRDVHDRMRAVGWPVFVVRSQEEAWAALAEAGAPVRHSLVSGAQRRAAG